jgi:alkylhydroperoxidase family enzyme
MTSKRMTTVLGQLGLVQVRHVSPVRRGAARGLVGRVYDQVEQEFGVLAPSLALFSPAPPVLAASWLMLRETLLVTRKVQRDAKEAVATTVSLGNACPWCATVHSTMLSGLTGGLVLADDPAKPVADPRLRAVTTWARDCRTEEGARHHEPACTAAEAPELIGTAVMFHYFNRMVNVFLTEVPLPPGAPRMVLGPVMQILDRRMRPAAQRPHQPGTSLDLLPAAALARDLSWASGDPVAEDAFARGCAAVDAAGARSVPPSVRDLVQAELEGWHGEPRGPSRAWADGPVAALPQPDQPAGRLALLTALASAQVDRPVVQKFLAGRAGDAALTELTAWASLAAARRVGTWIPRGQQAAESQGRAAGQADSDGRARADPAAPGHLPR